MKFKDLKNLSKYEFEKLRYMGMLWELYPEASDTYENTMKEILNEKA